MKALIAFGLLLSSATGFSQARDVTVLPSYQRELEEIARSQNFFIEQRKANGTIVLDPKDKATMESHEKIDQTKPLYRKGNGFDAIGNGAGGGSRQGATFSVGTGTRGGGSGVDCGDSHSVEVLDLYLGRQRVDGFLSPDASLEALGRAASEEASTSVLKLVEERIAKRLPSFAQRLHQGLLTLPFAAWTSAKDTLPSVEDLNSTQALARSCKRVQLAYRRGLSIAYAQSLYDRMRGLDRAALVLHEVVYALSGQTTSNQVRTLVSVLFSSEFESMKIERLEQLVRDTGLTLSNETPLVSQGASLVPLSKRPQARCGSLIYAQERGEQKFVGLSMRFSSQHQRFTQADISQEIRAAGSVNTYFDQTAGVLLDLKSGRLVLDSLKASKFYLQNKYPLYLFPAQSYAAEILCVDKHGPVSLEVSLFHLPTGDVKDARSAKLEIEYLSTPSPQRLREIKTIFAREEIEREALNKIDPSRLNWSYREDAKELETVKIYFEPQRSWNQHVYIEASTP